MRKLSLLFLFLLFTSSSLAFELKVGGNYNLNWSFADKTSLSNSPVFNTTNSAMLTIAGYKNGNKLSLLTTDDTNQLQLDYRPSPKSSVFGYANYNNSSKTFDLFLQNSYRYSPKVRLNTEYQAQNTITPDHLTQKVYLSLTLSPKPKYFFSLGWNITLLQTDPFAPSRESIHGFKLGFSLLSTKQFEIIASVLGENNMVSSQNLSVSLKSLGKKYGRVTASFGNYLRQDYSYQTCFLGISISKSVANYYISRSRYSYYSSVNQNLNLKYSLNRYFSLSQQITFSQSLSYRNGQEYSQSYTRKRTTISFQRFLPLGVSLLVDFSHFDDTSAGLQSQNRVNTSLSYRF